MTARGDSVLVTGGAGSIGSHVCKALARAGHVPLVADDLSTGHREAVRWGPLAEIVRQTAGAHHQYPDGFVLFCGTMFAPTDDRDGKGMGFTHKPGDVVTIATPSLGKLVNRVRRSDECAPWTFGTGALMRNLAARGLLRG